MSDPRNAPVAAGAPGADGPAGRGRSLPSALLRTARPKQWVKNVLVAVAPATAGVLHHRDVVLDVAGAFVAFCLCSSAIYFFNDWRDAEADRAHPVKRHRPIAAGDLGSGAALAVGVLLLAGGLALGAALTPRAGLALAGYSVLMLCYSVWLKHMAIVDVAVVAGGFVIRAVTGGFAVEVPLSDWFLIVASFGALFMVTGKRQAETMSLGEGSSAHRATLTAYSPMFLQHLLSVSASVTLIGYCLWAFLTQESDGGGPWLALSIIPFVLALLRYAMLATQGRGGEPEEVVLGDRPLQGLGLTWLALLAAGVYAAG